MASTEETNKTIHVYDTWYFVAQIQKFVQRLEGWENSNRTIKLDQYQQIGGTTFLKRLKLERQTPPKYRCCIELCPETRKKDAEKDKKIIYYGEIEKKKTRHDTNYDWDTNLFYQSSKERYAPKKTWFICDNM